MTTTIQINRKALISALTLASKVSPKRAVTPILSYVRLYIEGSVFKVDATDLDQDLMLPLAFEARITGGPLGSVVFNAVCVNLSEMISVAKISKAPSAYIVSSEDGFTLDGARLNTLPVQDWPHYDAPRSLKADGGTIALTNEDWLSYLAMVSPVASTEHMRYYLNGVLIRALSKSKVAIVATDGHRLAALEVDRFNTLKREAIIPNAALKTMALLFKLGGQSDKIALEFVGGGAVRMENEHFTYSTKVIDGSFPDYERIIPTRTDLSGQLFLDTETLTDAAKSILALPNSSKAPVAVLTALDAHMTLETSPYAPVQMSFTLYDTSMNGDIKACFNARYLADLGKTFDKRAELRLQFTDAHSPILITSPSVTGLSYVLMPIRG